MVQPAEESPPASFDSSRSFGDSQIATLVTSESFQAAVTAPGKEQLQLPQNIPFPDLRSSDDDGAEIKEGTSMTMESHDQNSKELLELEGEGNWQL